jgi:hypothetical protein
MQGQSVVPAPSEPSSLTVVVPAVLKEALQNITHNEAMFGIPSESMHWGSRGAVGGCTARRHGVSAVALCFGCFFKLLGDAVLLTCTLCNLASRFPFER